MIKVDNRQLTAVKMIVTALLPHVPEIMEFAKHKYFAISTRRPSWDSCFRNKNQIDIGGIDIHVHVPCINGYQTLKEMKFGVRTDKDGSIDLQKLADKINERKDEIKEMLATADENERIHDERISLRVKNGCVLDRLKEEGVIDHISEYTELHDGFMAEIALKDEEELRAFINFKNELLAKREGAAGGNSKKDFLLKTGSPLQVKIARDAISHYLATGRIPKYD